MIELLTKEAMIKKAHYWKEIFTKCNITTLEHNEDMNLN